MDGSHVFIKSAQVYVSVTDKNFGKVYYADGKYLGEISTIGLIKGLDESDFAFLQVAFDYEDVEEVRS